MSYSADVVVYMQGSDGTRARGFQSMGCNVLVSGAGAGASDEEIAACAEHLFTAEGRIRDLTAKLEAARRRVAELEVLQPTTARRIFGVGVVRVDERVNPWLMSRRDRG